MPNTFPDLVSRELLLLYPHNVFLYTRLLQDAEIAKIIDRPSLQVEAPPNYHSYLPNRP